MKSVLAASLGLATLASANNVVYPQHHFNYRRQNTTSSAAAAGEQLTTLTVQTTSVRTIISCAPTVTNCPANSASLTKLASTAPEQVSTVLVTDVIQLATTICPVTAAEGVSSSVMSVAATGGITGITVTGTTPGAGAVPTAVPTAAPSGIFSNGTLPTAPITAVSPEASTPASGDEDECEPDVTTLVSTSVATLTSAVPVTVTVTNGNGGGEQFSTSTSFTTFVTSIPVTKTVVNTESSPESTGESSPVEGGSGSGSEGTTLSGTTTTTAYSTGTKTATLTSKVTKPTDDSSPVDTNSNSGGSGSGSGAEGSCVPETVTVTKEGPTVYVTVGQVSPTGAASSVPLAANAAVPTAASAAASAAPTSASGEDDDTCEDDGSDDTSADSGDDDTCDEEPEETVTATVVPVPTGAFNDLSVSSRRKTHMYPVIAWAEAKVKEIDSVVFLADLGKPFLANIPESTFELVKSWIQQAGLYRKQSKKAAAAPPAQADIS
ncbi:hypothetical protein diail_885, partial [Diaporthe ilicicola]